MKSPCILLGETLAERLVEATVRKGKVLDPHTIQLGRDPYTLLKNMTPEVRVALKRGQAFSLRQRVETYPAILEITNFYGALDATHHRSVQRQVLQKYAVDSRDAERATANLLEFGFYCNPYTQPDAVLFAQGNNPFISFAGDSLTGPTIGDRTKETRMQHALLSRFGQGYQECNGFDLENPQSIEERKGRNDLTIDIPLAITPSHKHPHIFMPFGPFYINLAFSNSETS